MQENIFSAAREANKAGLKALNEWQAISTKNSQKAVENQMGLVNLWVNAQSKQYEDATQLKDISSLPDFFNAQTELAQKTVQQSLSLLQAQSSLFANTYEELLKWGASQRLDAVAGNKQTVAEKKKS